MSTLHLTGVLISLDVSVSQKQSKLQGKKRNIWQKKIQRLKIYDKVIIAYHIFRCEDSGMANDVPKNAAKKITDKSLTYKVVLVGLAIHYNTFIYLPVLFRTAQCAFLLKDMMTINVTLKLGSTVVQGRCHHDKRGQKYSFRCVDNCKLR